MLIQKLRVQRGWSQEQLAELTGLSVRTIQRIERGQNASVESLKAMASVFEVDFSTLREPQMDIAATSHVRADEALALAQVRKIKGFYIHLAQYGIVIAFLVVVNLIVSPRYFWAIWPRAGMGHQDRAARSSRVRQGAFPERRVGKAAGQEAAGARTVKHACPRSPCIAFNAADTAKEDGSACRSAPLLEASPQTQIHAFAAMAAFQPSGWCSSPPRKARCHIAPIGWIWVVLMLIISGSSFFLHGLRVRGQWSPIHLLSVFTRSH